MKKKVLAMLMASAMVFSLTACGGNAETVVEETQQEEIVEESSTKEETKQEETVVETSPKEVVEETQEVEKVEEPAEDNAPVQPTQRIAQIKGNGNPVDVTETLEYDAAGGYKVKGRLDDTKFGQSVDYEFGYDNKGEVTYMKHTFYSESAPNGITNEVSLIQGYPLIGTCSEPVEYSSSHKEPEYAYVPGMFGAAVGDYVEAGYTLVDSNGNLLGSCTSNSTFTMYDGVASIIGGNFGLTPFGNRMRTSSGNLMENANLSVSVEGNKTFVKCSFTEEEYDAERRETVNKEKLFFVDVISYGDNGLVESIKSYRSEFGIENLSELLESENSGVSVSYVYDSKGNVLEYKSSNVVVTYDYGNGTQTVNETQTVSDSEDTTSASIEGRWRCRSENYPYDAIFFDSDGTGNLYKGIDAYPLKYTFDGTKAYVTADGQEFTFYVYLDENKMIEGESDAPYDKEQ